MSNLTELTHDEIERMRAIVMAHDKNSGKIQEFDLNNPPTPPYRYQPFPKTTYKGTQNRIVRDQAELDLALQAGWSTSPAMAMAAAAAPELDAETSAEVAEVDARIAAAKKNRK